MSRLLPGYFSYLFIYFHCNLMDSGRRKLIRRRGPVMRPRTDFLILVILHLKRDYGYRKNVCMLVDKIEEDSKYFGRSYCKNYFILLIIIPYKRYIQYFMLSILIRLSI